MKLIEKIQIFNWFVKFTLQILCALHKKINNLEMKKYGLFVDRASKSPKKIK